ncbi:MAG: hypothetical protein Kow006_13610 [Gammaproteobacteria bacterium]
MSRCKGTLFSRRPDRGRSRWLFASAGFIALAFLFPWVATLAAPGDTLFFDDFERAALGTNWTVDGSGGGQSAIGTHTASSGTRSMYTRWEAVSTMSPVFNLSGIGADLSFWLRRGSDAFSEDPEVPGDEDLVLEYLNSANNWVELARYPGGGTPGEIFTPTFSLPVDALHAGFRFRFRQIGGHGPDYDYYHIDDVRLVETLPPAPIVGGFCDDFESGLGNWVISASGGSAGIGTQTALSPTSSLYLRWDTVTVTSRVLDLSGLTSGSIQYWVRRGADTFSEDPDSGEDLVVEYYTAGGAWQVLDTFTGSGTEGEVFTRNYPLPADARHAAFQLRFRYLQGDGSDFDYWHVDDVCAGPSGFPPPAPVAYYAMDEASWSGAAGEVTDGSGNGNHGTATGSASTENTTPAIAGNPGTCGYGVFPYNTSAAAQDAVDTGVDINDDVGNRGTISFWYRSNERWNGNRGDRQLFDASVNLPGGAGVDKYFFLVLQSNPSNNGRLLFGLEDTNDNDYSALTGTNNIAANTWVHIAATWDMPGDRLQIYINGSLAAQATPNTNGVLGELGNLHIGDNSSTYFASGSSPNSANGRIDEVRIYDFVQSTAQIQADMNATHPCTALIDHFRIDAGAGVASTCLPRAVTITAEDASNNPVTGYTGSVALSTSSGHGSWSVNTAAGTLSDPTADDGSAGYGFVAGDSGSIILDLSNVHADDLTVTVSDASAGVSSTSGVISFRDNAFVLSPTTCTGASCPGSGSSEVVAGRNHDFHVEFWRRDAPVSGSCGIETAYSGSRNLKAWRTDDADHPPAAAAPSVGAVTLPTALPGADNLTLNFVAGEADFTLATSDVGKYALNLRDESSGFAVDAGGNPRPIDGSSGTLTVRPFAIDVSAIQSGATANPGVDVPTGAIFTAAGSDMQATVRGVRWQGGDDADGDGVPDSGANLTDNAVTGAYAWATTLDAGAALGLTYQPAAGVRGALTRGSGSTTLAAAEFAGGAATPTDLRYSEVGSFTMGAAASGFLNTAGVDVQGWSGVIGRFTPAYFDAALNTPQLDTWCDAGGFTYLGQIFAYSVQPVISVTARNALGGTTLNYTRPGWFRMSNTKFDISGNKQYQVLTGTLDTAAVPAVDPVIAYGPGTGIATLTFSSGAPGTGFAFVRGAPVAPFDAEIGLSINVIDEDDIVHPGNPVRFGDDTAGNGIAFDSGKAMRWGRVALGNGYGSELVDLSLPLTVEYWEDVDPTPSTAYGFVTHSADSCTGLAAGDFGFANYSGNLDPGETAINGVSLVSGSGAVSLSAPGAGNQGEVDVVGQGTLPTHLLFDWDGDGNHDNPPAGHATFGIFSGSPRRIYLREVY